ncbi:MAG: hypothetical protein MI806_14210 [Minwuiales bacterium]|nr:hypothetical protein [Minwuiales bacterium]
MGNVYVAPDGTAWRWQGRRFVSTGATRRSLNPVQMSKRVLGQGPTAVRLGPDEMQNRNDLLDVTRSPFEEFRSDVSKPSVTSSPVGSDNAGLSSELASVLGERQIAEVNTEPNSQIGIKRSSSEQNQGDLGEKPGQTKQGAQTKITGEIGEISVLDLEIVLKRAWPCGSMMPSVISTGPSALLDESKVCLFFNVAGSVKLTVICEERSNDSENRLVNRWENQITVHARIPNEIRYVVGTILPGRAGRVLSIARALRRLPEAEQAIRESLEIIELLQSEAVRLATQKGLDGVCKLST